MKKKTRKGNLFCDLVINPFTFIDKTINEYRIAYNGITVIPWMRDYILPTFSIIQC